MDCPICSCVGYSFDAARRSFYRCRYCGFVWADRASRLDAAAAKQRYALHNNDPEDSAYVGYLDRIHDLVFNKISGLGLNRPRSVLDWGSGPNPVGADRLRRRSCAVDIWDPLFANDKKPDLLSYDAVFCVETAEHFKNPAFDFADMASRLKRGGFLAVHTHLAPDSDDEFRSWWYIQDPTHIAFYTEKALRVLAEDISLSVIDFIDRRLTIFRSPLSVLAVGGIALDIVGKAAKALRAGDSNPGAVSIAPGGVARNAAENLVRLGLGARLVAVVGDDEFGRAALKGTSACGVGVEGVAIAAGDASAAYLALIDADGLLSAAIAGMGLYDRWTVSALRAAVERSAAAAIKQSFFGEKEYPFAALIVDANPAPELLDALLDAKLSSCNWLDPVSAAKAERVALYDGGRLIKRFNRLKPNRAETRAIGASLGLAIEADSDPIWLAALVAEACGAELWLSLGEKGLAVVGSSGIIEVESAKAAVISTNGAGDALLAAAARGAVLKLPLDMTARQASAAAFLAVTTPETCPYTLSARRLRLDAVSIAYRCRPSRAVEESK